MFTNKSMPSASKVSQTYFSHKQFLYNNIAPEISCQQFATRMNGSRWISHETLEECILNYLVPISVRPNKVVEDLLKEKFHFNSKENEKVNIVNCETNKLSTVASNNRTLSTTLWCNALGLGYVCLHFNLDALFVILHT